MNRNRRSLSRPGVALVFVAALLLAVPAAASPYPLDQILPAAAAAKLSKVGVKTTKDLLKHGGKRKSRRQLAKKAGVQRRDLKRWVQMADVMRIKGVGPEMTRLLAAANVHSVAKLRRQRAKPLHKRMMAINAKKKISGNPPSVAYVVDWIKKAKRLRIIVR